MVLGLDGAEFDLLGRLMAAYRVACRLCRRVLLKMHHRGLDNVQRMIVAGSSCGSSVTSNG